MVHYSQTNSFGGYEVAKSMLSVHISNEHRVKPLVSIQKTLYCLDCWSGIKPDPTEKEKTKLQEKEQKKR